MDDLDHKTDEELNELFAVEVAGWTYRTFPDGALPHVKHWQDAVQNTVSLHTQGAFCASADAVLPYLDAFMWVARNTLDCGRFAEHLSVPAENGLHSVKVITDGIEHVGVASTFARAAVLALIRAKKEIKS